MSLLGGFSSNVTRNARQGMASEKKGPPNSMPPTAASLSSQPPETPTRTLLQRIQRRSSTSAESVVSMASRNRRSVMQGDGLEVCEFGRREKVNAKPYVSSLPRHSRTTSMLNGKTHTVRTSSKPCDQEVRTTDTLFTSQTLRKRRPSVIDAKKTGKAVCSPTSDQRSDRSETQQEVQSEQPPVKTVAGQDSSIQHTSPAFRSLSSPPRPADERVRTITKQLSRAEILREAAVNGSGLTREAALSLEQEFASQERILQGLQRDNETKTVEVEELRRQKARLEEFCARHFGEDDWRDIVFKSHQPSVVKAKEGNNTAVDLSVDGKETSLSPQGAKEGAKNSCSSQAVVEDLLRTLASPVLPSSPSMERKSNRSIPRSPLAPISFPDLNVHQMTIDSAGTSVMHSTPTKAKAHSQCILEDLSLASTVDEASFASAQDMASPRHDGPPSVTVRRNAVLAVIEAQKQLLRAIQSEEERE